MRVLGSRVVVKRLDMPKLSSKLIEIVEHNPEPSQYGLVLFVGNGERLQNGARRPIDLKPGETVILRDYSGSPVKVKLNGREVDAVVVAEEDCLAVVNL